MLVKKFFSHLLIGTAIVTVTACGGGGGGGSNDTTNSNGTSNNTYTYKGTVTGTLIEAFCDNGAYYQTTSDHNGSSRHPFELSLPAGMACSIVMTTNENDPTNSVATQVAFIDANGQVSNRASAPAGVVVELGHIDLPVDRASANDGDGDGVQDILANLGQPAGLEVEVYLAGTTWDSDGDNIVEVYDDEDDDGVLNKDDNDYSRASTDRDRDGLDDDADVNPYNSGSHDNRYPEYRDHDQDGYLDEDYDRDGYYDDDHDQDGFHDDDHDRDGYHDDDHDRDGFSDSSTGDEQYAEAEGTVSNVNGNIITITVAHSERAAIANGNSLEIDASNTRFDNTSLAAIQPGDYIEAEGAYDGIRLVAFEVEKESHSSSSSSSGNSEHHQRPEVEGSVTRLTGSTITIQVARSEFPEVSHGQSLDIDASNARFEDTSLTTMQTGDYIEAEGTYQGTHLQATKIESENNDAYDDDGYENEVEGRVTNVSGNVITITVTDSEGVAVSRGSSLEIDASNARFEDTSLASMRNGDYIEAEGSYDGVRLIAVEIEREDD